MSSCTQTIVDYGLRAIGIGERMLPRSDFTLCQQFTLIGSGMLWNIYFGIIALAFGFILASFIAVGKASSHRPTRKMSEWFIFIFRGSPLFIQMFFGYFLFLAIKQRFPSVGFITSAWSGALIVLILNTTAYTAEIFYGALRSIPKGEVEAADAYGLSGWPRFKRIIWPTMLRLAWPAYTNEAIFSFHATTLVFFTGFPAKGQQGDALYYASYFADKTFNPFVPYPILAMYFIILTLIIVTCFGAINGRLNRHLDPQERSRLRRPKFSLVR